MKKQNFGYWQNVGRTVSSIWRGLGITLSHMVGARHTRKSIDIQQTSYFSHQKGIATIQFPHEQIPVPDNGRYKLHNEIDDCIVCDKCAKVCPVDCITIEPIKSATEFGRTSDDTPKRIYAAKFDIDMGKCCFCGLCTTVCPTECLTMTKEFDFSVTNMAQHNFAFANLTEQQAEQKRKEWEDFQINKAQAVASTEPKPPTSAKPIFKPRLTPPPTESNT